MTGQGSCRASVPVLLAERSYAIELGHEFGVRISLRTIAGDLADLLAGRIARPADAARCTLFKSVGSALEDLAAAELVLATAP